MVFSPGGPQVPIKWFWADPNALLLGFPTPFASANWEEKPDRFDQLGEQPGKRPWVSGLRPYLLQGRRLCKPYRYLANGLGQGRILDRAVTTEGVPLCCLAPDESPLDGVGVGNEFATAWVASAGGPFSGQSRWFRDTRGLTGYALLFAGKATWTPGIIMPALYKKTILTNPTPGMTFIANFTCQPWTLRLRRTHQGAGGGGGGSKGGSSTSSAGGGGSSGGSHINDDTGAFGGLVIPYQLAGGGAGGLAGTNDGSPGTDLTTTSAPTAESVDPGNGGKGGIAVPFITGGVVSPGGASVPGGNHGFPGLVIPGASGNTPLGGQGGDSVLTGSGGDQILSQAPGDNALPGSGSGGSGAVSATADQPGGNGADAFIVIEEWNF